MAAAHQASANCRGGGGFWILSAGDLAQRRFAGYAKRFRLVLMRFGVIAQLDQGQPAPKCPNRKMR